jgi:hypothetical protein
MLGAILANSVVKTNCIFSFVSCKWDVTFTPRPPLHHVVTSNTACPTGSLWTCQWRLPGSHPRIEVTSVRCHLYAPSCFTPHGYIKYCMPYRIVMDMSVKTSRAPPENRTHVITLRFSRLYLLGNKIFMLCCGISVSWRSDVLFSQLLYKKQNLIGVFWLKAGHIKRLLTIRSEFALWVWGEERVYVKTDSELLGEWRREITGGLASSSFSIMYFFFIAISALPRDPLVKMNHPSARLQTRSSQCLNLITATTFFLWRFKEMILT